MTFGAIEDVVLLLLVALTLWLPGGLVGAACGLRGWTLAATGPLITYGIVGLAGPASSVLGVRWSVLPLLVATFLVAAVSTVASRLFPVARGAPSPWRPGAHLAVASCVATASSLSTLAVVGGMQGLRTLSQGLDGAFHVAGVRWILENGDAGLRAMTHAVWYLAPEPPFYPNAYHLPAVVVAQLTGRDIPSLINAHTVVTLAVLSLGVAALVRRCGGRAVHAGAAALLVAAAGGVYDPLWRGPTVVFMMGLALLPAAFVLMCDLFDAAGRRARLRRGVPFVLGLGGALALHPSIVVTLAVVALPWLVVRAAVEPGRLVRDLVTALAAGALTAVVYAGQFVSAVGAAGDAVSWPVALPPLPAAYDLLTFSSGSGSPRWWLVAATLVGLLAWRRLADLRWVPLAAALVGTLFVAAASSDAAWAETLTRPWWNDRYRLAAVAVVLLAIVAGHGVAEASRLLAVAAARIAGHRVARVPLVATSALAGLLVLAVLAVASRGFYLSRNETLMAHNARDGASVSAGEVDGYAALATMVGPGERVMNDFMDGSAWIYALTGTQAVTMSYYEASSGPDGRLLNDRFRFYDTDPAVREAARRLGVRWAVVGQPYPGVPPRPGVTDLDRVQALREVWNNGAVRIYRLADS